MNLLPRVLAAGALAAAVTLAMVSFVGPPLVSETSAAIGAAVPVMFVYAVILLDRPDGESPA